MTPRRCGGSRIDACSRPANARCSRRPRANCSMIGNAMDFSQMPLESIAPPPGLPREERLATVAALIHAHAEAIALARRHVKVFDIDLSWGAWNTAARFDALDAFLRRNPGARFDIIVHDTHWIEASGARLTMLLGCHSDAMTIYR